MDSRFLYVNPAIPFGTVRSPQVLQPLGRRTSEQRAATPIPLLLFSLT